jgi:PAS domain S-box-containing protein
MDEDQTRQLLDELARLRCRVAELEAAAAAPDRTAQDLAVFRRFADSFGRGLGTADMEGRIDYVNPALCRMLGAAAPCDMLGGHISAYCPDPYRRQWDEEIVPSLLNTGQWNGESAVLTRQGRVIPTLANAFVLRNAAGQPLRMAVAITDLTERKQAEEALRQTHEQLLAVYDGMVEGFAIFDIETFQVVQANAALCRMLGYTEEEVKSLTPEQKHPPEAFPSLREHYATVLREGDARLDSVPCFRKDGGLVYLEIVSKLIVFNDRPAVVIFFHDITERKQAIDALQKERQTLWHLLQASDHERQLIAYEIHDGLAQYLAAAGMQLQTYAHLRDSDPLQAKKVYEAATQLVSQSHFEARRLISGVRPPVLDEAGLETAIAHLVHDERVFKGLEIELHSEVQFDRLPAILENALYRIAQEALTNAWKHSQSKQVRVGLLQAGPKIRLEVQDWGIGFDPAVVGSGHFGLEGMRERVRLLGGMLEIHTAPGAGTRIQVDVPIVERMPNAVVT